MILERELTVPEMLDWIEAEAQARGVAVTLFRNDVEQRTEGYSTADGVEKSYTYVIVRIRINTVLDLSKEIKFMVNLQETWNNREPRPEKLLHLIPSGVPQGVW